MLSKIGNIVKWIAWLVAAVAAALTYYQTHPSPPVSTLKSPIGIYSPISNDDNYYV
jgi:hypothetical protein